jgi:O-antigen/teichoic acid export membrane protein
MSEEVRSSLKSAAKGTVLVFAGMAVSQLLWFFSRLLIARNISAEDLGIYSLMLAIVSITSLVASLGLWDGSTRYISVLSGQGRKGEADSVQRSSLIIGGMTGTAACLLLLILSQVLSRHVFYKPELRVPLMVASLFIPFNVVAMVLASVLRGYRVIGPKVYFMDMGQPFFFFLFIAVIFLLGMPFIGIVWAYVLSIIAVCLLIALFGFREKVIMPVAPVIWKKHVAELLKFSIPVLMMDVMFLIFRMVDTLMLGRYAPAGDVGVYSIAVSLAFFIILPLMALEFVYMPIAGELYAKKRSPELERTYQVLTKWIFSATLPVFFILFFFPEMTILFLFGDQYVDASQPLRILTAGYLFFVFMGTNSMLLLVLGHSKAVMKVSAAGAMLNVLLNYILIKLVGLGMQGAAISSFVSFFVVSSGYSAILYRLSGIHPIAASYLKPVTGSGVIGLGIYVVAKSLPLHSWMLPVYFLLFICGYLVSLVFTKSVDESDVHLFETILKKTGVAPEGVQRIAGRIRKYC